MTTIRLIVATVLLAVIAPASAHAALPDPLVRGPYTVTTMSVADPAHAGAPGDPGEAKLGLASLEEPNGTGGAIGTGTPNAAANAVQLQVRGSLYYPSNRSSASPLIVLVHGNRWVTGAPSTRGALGAPDTGNVETLAKSLFTDWVWAFEMTAVLLVIAVVGSVVLARRSGHPVEDAGDAADRSTTSEGSRV